MTKDESGHEPIEAEFRERMNALAAVLQQFLNGENTPVKESTVGFVLLMFKMGEAGDRCNYISNSNREDVLATMREFLARATGEMKASDSIV